jgi:histone demethylase JARID1
MLLCDGRCGHAYHTKCLDPPLEHVPRGAWFCSDCLRLPVA